MLVSYIHILFLLAKNDDDTDVDNMTMTRVFMALYYTN